MERRKIYRRSWLWAKIGWAILGLGLGLILPVLTNNERGLQGAIEWAFMAVCVVRGWHMVFTEKFAMKPALVPLTLALAPFLAGGMGIEIMQFVRTRMIQPAPVALGLMVFLFLAVEGTATASKRGGMMAVEHTYGWLLTAVTSIFFGWSWGNVIQGVVIFLNPSPNHVTNTVFGTVIIGAIIAGSLVSMITRDRFEKTDIRTFAWALTIGAITTLLALIL